MLKPYRDKMKACGVSGDGEECLPRDPGSELRMTKGREL